MMTGALIEELAVTRQQVGAVWLCGEGLKAEGWQGRGPMAAC